MDCIRYSYIKKNLKKKSSKYNWHSTTTCLKPRFLTSLDVQQDGFNLTHRAGVSFPARACQKLFSAFECSCCYLGHDNAASNPKLIACSFSQWRFSNFSCSLSIVSANSSLFLHRQFCFVFFAENCTAFSQRNMSRAKKFVTNSINAQENSLKNVTQPVT